MLIGPGGGTIETRDAGGVLIRLLVPPRALTRDTEIVMTPLQASPMPDASTALHPGVKFEPEGLQFAKPAVLTLDFSTTGQAVTDDHFIFLLTSPLSMVPLFGHADPGARTITASVHHFSEIQGGEGDPAYSDPAAWVNEVLASPGNLSLSELQSVLAAVALAQQLGQDGDIDLAQLQQKAADSIAALTTQACQGGQSSPSDQALDRLLQLETLAQQLGVEPAGIRGCVEAVLRALIEREGNRALLDPSDANLQRLLDLAARAQQLGFQTLETLGLEQIELAMRELSRRVLGQVDTARATDQEAAVIQQAKDQLQGAIDFVTTTGAAVLTVAPTLDDDLQRALDSLGEVMSMRLVGTNNCLRISPSDPSQNQFKVCIPDGSTPPFSASLQSADGTMQLSVTKPQPNVLAFDGSMAAVRIGGTGQLSIDLTFSRPGTLMTEVNPSFWLGGSGVTFYFGPGIFLCQPDPSRPGCLATSRTTSISSQQTVRGTLVFGGLSGAMGSGRLLTITFTPSP